MNNISSGCSSGCESGWTMYLNQSSNSQENNIFQQKNKDIIRYSSNKQTGDYFNGCDDEDEDLSMVSDASSGPPYLGEINEYSVDETRHFRYEGNKSKKNKNKGKKSVKKEHYLYLDDTASSPIKNHMRIPSGGASKKHSTHYKEGKSAFQKHIDFSQSSMSKESGSGAAGYLQGRKWE